MLTAVITNVSYLISAIAFFGLTVLFGDSLLLRFELKTFLKALGFGILGALSLINLYSHDYTTVTLWGFFIAFSIIFISFIIDPHSIFKYSFFLPILTLVFLRDHALLLVAAVAIAIAVFQLVYSTKHRDLIPLGVGFVLISVGEYFYYLKTQENLKFLSTAGSFLYLFASVLFLAWLWSYLVLRMVYLFKKEVT